MKSTTRSNAAGFSLAELMIIVGMISVVMVAATAVMPNMLKRARADGSTAIVVNTLRLARDRAISERRNMDVVFVNPNRIQIQREEISAIIPPPIPAPAIVRTTIMDVVLETDQRFMYYTGTGDTDDAFGLANKPIAFGPTVGTIPMLVFTSEGTLMDGGTGDAINGTVFLGSGADATSARAVTIFGVTALVRSWKWNGKKWVE